MDFVLLFIIPIALVKDFCWNEQHDENTSDDSDLDVDKSALE